MMIGNAQYRTRLGGRVGLCSTLMTTGMIFCCGLGLSEEQDKSKDVYAGKTVAGLDFARRMVQSRMKNAPLLSEPAPDFTVTELDSGKEVQLSKICRRKPVVLMFGSSTCGETNRSIEQIADLSKRFADKVQFLLVYIREAHPSDGLSFGQTSNINDPKNFAERLKAAAVWKKSVNLPFPIVIDGMNDQLATRWAGWPVRLYVIDEKQKIVYAGQQGPWLYKPTKKFNHGVDAEMLRGVDQTGFSKESLEGFLEKLPATKD